MSLPSYCATPSELPPHISHPVHLIPSLPSGFRILSAASFLIFAGRRCATVKWGYHIRRFMGIFPPASARIVVLFPPHAVPVATSGLPTDLLRFSTTRRHSSICPSVTPWLGLSVYGVSRCGVYPTSASRPRLHAQILCGAACSDIVLVLCRLICAASSLSVTRPAHPTPLHVDVISHSALASLHVIHTPLPTDVFFTKLTCFSRGPVC